MGLIGLFLASNIFAAQLFVCLRSAEQVSSQLGAAHVIEDFLVLLQALALVDFLDAKPSVQTLIPFVLENGEILPCLDTSHLRGFNLIAHSPSSSMYFAICARTCESSASMLSIFRFTSSMSTSSSSSKVSTYRGMFRL